MVSYSSTIMYSGFFILLLKKDRIYKIKSSNHIIEYYRKKRKKTYGYLVLIVSLTFPFIKGGVIGEPWFPIMHWEST